MLETSQSGLLTRAGSMCEIIFRLFAFMLLCFPFSFLSMCLLFKPPLCFLMLISIEAPLCRGVGLRLQLPAALSPLLHTSSLMNLFCLSAAAGPIIRLKSPGPLGAPESNPAAAHRRKIKTQNTI